LLSASTTLTTHGFLFVLAVNRIACAGRARASRPARRAAWLCRPPGNGRTTQTPTHANTHTTHPPSGLWSLIIIKLFDIYFGLIFIYT